MLRWRQWQWPKDQQSISIPAWNSTSRTNDDYRLASKVDTYKFMTFRRESMYSSHTSHFTALLFLAICTRCSLYKISWMERVAILKPSRSSARCFLRVSPWRSLCLWSNGMFLRRWSYFLQEFVSFWAWTFSLVLHKLCLIRSWFFYSFSHTKLSIMRLS